MGPWVTRLLLDSVIVIDHFNGVPAATKYLREHHEDIAISVMTRAEALTGFDGKREVLAGAALLRLSRINADLRGSRSSAANRSLPFISRHTRRCEMNGEI